MTYSYGLHGAPAVGGGLPGLPQRQSGGSRLALHKEVIRITGVSNQVWEPPEDAIFVRVAAVGAGGAGFNESASLNGRGGGGGGVAATGFIKPQTLLLTASSAKTPKSGTGSTASIRIGDRILRGRPGGSATSTVPGQGGTADGGDYNYTGESAPAPTIYDRSAAGGGAAGIQEWGVPKGSTGGVARTSANTGVASGGGGVGSASGFAAAIAASDSGYINLTAPPDYGYGSPSPNNLLDGSPDGGDGGGGGGGAKQVSGLGGCAMIFIEIFRYAAND